MTELAVTAFAPASIGNVGVGFDLLGLAISGAGDRVRAERREETGVTIRSIRDAAGAKLDALSDDAASNTASIAAAALWQAHGQGGLLIDIEKGVPLQSGMGSSAASAVAAAVAANALLDTPLPLEDLLPFALEGEAFASGGRHADNVAPSLLGGLVLCAPGGRIVSLPVPAGLSSVLLHPELSVNTAESRQRLQADVPRALWTEQQGLLAAFVAACYSGDLELMRASLKDVVIEPQRGPGVACFDRVSRAARDFGVIGCSLSGSGPSIFAIVEEDRAVALAAVMREACDVECQTWISPLDAPGAQVVDS